MKWKSLFVIILALILIGLTAGAITSPASAAPDKV